MHDQPMRKAELKGAVAVLDENATAALMQAKSAGCSPKGHEALVDATLVIGRMVKKGLDYDTNGASFDHMDAAKAVLIPELDTRILTMATSIDAKIKASEDRIIAANNSGSVHNTLLYSLFKVAVKNRHLALAGRWIMGAAASAALYYAAQIKARFDRAFPPIPAGKTASAPANIQEDIARLQAELNALLAQRGKP